jgi:hypothetical protein
MGTLAPNSIAVAAAHDQDQVVVDNNHPKVGQEAFGDDDQLDAGARFVLKSKGNCFF